MRHDTSTARHAQAHRQGLRVVLLRFLRYESIATQEIAGTAASERLR
eukprot:SAG11_NODE_2740_length_3022_cov_2.199795_5_plen_47_part_00